MERHLLNTTHQCQNALGVFDSGIGGLTVLKKLIEILPTEDTIYLGDTARLPYGEKSPETILRCSTQNADFLFQQSIKLLVVACNTASAYSKDFLSRRFPIPVIDVIDPAIDQALCASSTKKIVVLGTRATVNSGIYEKKLREKECHAEVFSLACPLFVPLVEENFLSHRATKLIIEEYLTPVISKNFDTLILGCTHYPRLIPVLREIVGDHVAIVDSATACVEAIKTALHERSLNKKNERAAQRRYYASDDLEKFKRLGEHFLESPIEKVERYSIEEF